VIVDSNHRDLTVSLPQLDRHYYDNDHDDSYGVKLTSLVVIANKGSKSVNISAHHGNTIDERKKHITLSYGRCVTLQAYEDTWYEIC
jgi:hypothetical protein